MENWFGLTTLHDRMLVNYNSGVDTSNVVKMSNYASWKSIISSYDHVYIVIRSGRAEDKNPMPGTPDTRYKLYLSQGPWPLVEKTV
jgi:hypothetical protein